MMKCVFGILKTVEGINIADEMRKWLLPMYEVIEVRQNPPGELFEYPAIALAFDLAAKSDEPVLYIHTKGAANVSPIQEEIRKMWKNELGSVESREKYLRLVDSKDPRIATPIMSEKKDTWFNAFIINAAAGRVLSDKVRPEEQRHVFEYVARGTCVDVMSPYPPKDGVPIFDLLMEINKKSEANR